MTPFPRHSTWGDAYPRWRLWVAYRHEWALEAQYQPRGLVYTTFVFTLEPVEGFGV